MRQRLFLIAMFCAGCAGPDRPATPPGASPTLPHRRPPPTVPYSAETSLLADRVEEAVRLYDKERWERFVDAMDQGELASDLRLAEDEIDKGQWKKEELFQNGDDLFEHDFGTREGYGPGHARVHRPEVGGPDALSCAECHHRGGFNGSGDLSQNAFFDGDGLKPDSAFERNPPAVLGLGLEQKLAEEMTTELQAIASTAVRNARSGGPQTARLVAKGVEFGTITAGKDGTLDTSQLRGIDPDLVVRPFGWKGDVATLRDFVTHGFQVHFGIQLAGADLPGKGPAWDKDADGVPAEISEGMLTTVVLYLSRLETPVMIPPRDPALLARHARGFDLFQSVGCASCHVPSLPLVDPVLKVSEGLSSNLLTEGEAPRPRADVYGYGPNGTPIFLFSDLKRHDMGPALAERRPVVGQLKLYGGQAPVDREIPAATFLTRPLWGVAETGPWLHDGRAKTLDEAILAHGGEGKTARDAFATLPADSKADLRIFLLSLTRYPRIEFR